MGPVVSVGCVAWDLIARIPAFPVENGRARILELFEGVGGPAAVAAVVLGRLGETVRLVGRVGTDAPGRRVLEALPRFPLLSADVEAEEGLSSQFSLVLSAVDRGTRTIVSRRRSDTPMPPLPPDAGWVHADDVYPAWVRAAAREARRRGLPLSLDVGHLPAEEIRSLLEEAPGAEAIVDEERGAAVDPDPVRACRRMLDWGAKVAVVTLGPRGAVGGDREGVYRCPAVPVQVQDSTGAGDVYHGVYVWARRRGAAVPEAMRLAAAGAALSCEGFGGLGRPFTREEMLAAAQSLAGKVCRVENG